MQPLVAVDQACDAILRERALPLVDLERVLDACRAHPAPPIVDTARDRDDSQGRGPFPSVQRMFASCRSDEIDASCPQCGSSDVSEEPLGYEFTRMRCAACGNDDTCDVWQLDEWYA
jgi:hypothetical protein